MERMNQLEILIEYLGTENALEALVRQMSNTEMNEAFTYICRMYEINLPMSEE